MAPVTLVTIHHEGGGSPTDNVGRYSEGGYCYGIGITKFERWRAPADNWATLNFNGQDLTICLSGNRMDYAVTDDDIDLIHGAFMDSFGRGEVTGTPTVRDHQDSPGSATACSGDFTRGRWSDVVAACSSTSAPKPEPEPKPKGGAMDIVRTPSGKGYYIVASDGGVFCFGDAKFFGSMGGKPLTKPMVDMAVRPQGDGYWLAAEDGGVFTFGKASYQGGMGGKHLNAPITGIECDAEGDGYWLLAADGGVFTFGKTGFYGAATGKIKGY
jgi:hypothetical protein